MKNLLMLIAMISMMYSCSSTNAKSNKDVSEVKKEEPAKPSIPTMDEHGWYLDYATAMAAAKDQNKHLLMLFTGSDWCRPCQWLERDVFESDKFKAYAKDNLVTLKADFPRRKGNSLSPEQTKKNRELSNKFGIRSFPTVFILDKKGQQKQSFKGYGRTGVEGYLQNIKGAIGS